MTLEGQIDKQEAILSGAPFHTLSRRDRFSLLRFVASSNAVNDGRLDVSRARLKRAVAMDPTDVRSVAMLLLACSAPRPLRHLLDMAAESSPCGGLGRSKPGAELAKPGCPMKILLAVPHFPPRRVGGTEWETLRVAKGLQALGHRVRIVCVEEVDRGNRAGALHDETRLRWMDDEHEGIAVRRLFLRLGGLPPRVEYDSALVGAAVERLIAEDRPDLLHLYQRLSPDAQPVVGCPLARGPRRRQPHRHVGAVPARPHAAQQTEACPRRRFDPGRCVRCLAEEQRRYQEFQDAWLHA